MNKKPGFTVIEILTLVVFLTAVGIIFAIQRGDIAAKNRDDQRKVAINSIYYSLEEVFYRQHEFYPESISEENLPGVDPEIFTDPRGVVLGKNASNYRYEAKDCEDGRCQSYTLRTTLEKEDDFIKESRN